MNALRPNMISKITTLLVLLCMNSRMFSYGESLMRSLSEEDDIELERKVQRLNKTPKKSFQVKWFWHCIIFLVFFFFFHLLDFYNLQNTWFSKSIYNSDVKMVFLKTILTLQTPNINGTKAKKNFQLVIVNY